MTEEEKLYLKTAGFTIKIVFGDCEIDIYKKKILGAIKEIWGRHELLEDSGKHSPDFEIRFIWPGDAKLNYIQKPSGVYLLTYRRDLKKRILRIYYHVGLQVFDGALREVFSFLLSEETGFLLHGASSKDKNDVLHIFMAKTGGGKSTLNKILNEQSFTPFSDDMLIIKKEERWTAYSPPFVEKKSFPRKQKANKIKLYFVRKGETPKIEPINDKTKVLKMVLEQVWLRESYIDSDILKIITNFVENNEFYYIDSVIDSEEMAKLINEA